MKRATAFLEKTPLFLFLIPLFLVIHIEKEFRGLIPYEFVYRQIVELFIAPVVILLFCFLLFRNWRKALAFTLSFMIVFYFFADLKDWLSNKFPNSIVSSYTLLLPVMLVICIACFVLVKRSKSSFRRLFLFTNLLFLLFILADLIAFAATKDKMQHSSDTNITNVAAPCKDCERPDIYYVVFDSYTSSERLKGEFGFDNSRMDSFLSQKGFYQVQHSKSNYNFTAYSIASTFNLDYLKGIRPNKKIFLRDYLPYIGLIRENLLVSSLEKEGYEIVNHSVFNFRHHPSTIPPYDLWDINTLYKRHNIFLKMDMEIGWMLRSKMASQGKAYLPEAYILSRDRHDSLALAGLKQTLDLKNTKPRFVYTHIEIPHAPFSFDSSGKRFRVPVQMSPEQDKADYVDQLIYSNTKVREVINSIFEKSQRPFIIILQGDHGFRYFNREKSEMEFDNLSAFYFYNKDYKLLHDSMSNVNTFRVVLNTFFNRDYPMLKDSTTFLPY